MEAHSCWDGGDFFYGADLLVRDNVVVVTLNYRLSALGFLSTGDKHAQGNYGLKDILLALRWVKDNVATFGGNPERITVFGQSAGAVAIHMLMLADKHEGLFHQAIMLSGTALAPFAFQKSPLEMAKNLGYRLGLKFNSTKDLIEKLRNVHFKDILKAQKYEMGVDYPAGLLPFSFAACAEPSDSLEETILTDEPINLMLRKTFRNANIPMILGTTSNEGLLTIRQNFVFKKLYEDIKWERYLVPLSFNIRYDIASTKEVIKKFKAMYFNNQRLSSTTLGAFALFNTDAQFKFPTNRAVKIMAQTATEPIYYYNFSYEGSFNVVKNLYFLRKYPGACHIDDVFYLFKSKIPLPIWPSAHDLIVRKRHVRLLTNFARHGHPTPETDDLIKVIWPRYDPQNEEYLDIGYDLVAKSSYSQDRLQIWHDYQRQFTDHL